MIIESREIRDAELRWEYGGHSAAERYSRQTHSLAERPVAMIREGQDPRWLAMSALFELRGIEVGSVEIDFSRERRSVRTACAH